jgi:hypothetical protein
MRVYLLTCESIQNTRQIVRRLASFPKRVTVRLPIQWDDINQRIDDPADYRDDFEAISKVADIMIEFVDSDAMKNFSVDEYEVHVKKCLDELGEFCSLAEAGNEVNGNWLANSTDPPSITYDKVKKALSACSGHLPAAVTYYLSADDPRQMFEWINRYPLESSHVLISHYPNTTPDSVIDPLSVFTEVSESFPTSSIGWGEYGTEDADNNNHASTKDRKKMIRFVESDCWSTVSQQLNAYVGGGGYWDWRTDRFSDSVLKDIWK